MYTQNIRNSKIRFQSKYYGIKGFVLNQQETFFGPRCRLVSRNWNLLNKKTLRTF